MQTSRPTPEYGSPLQAQQAGVLARLGERVSGTRQATAPSARGGFLAVL